VPNPVPEERLIASARSGDRDAFDELFRRERPYVFNLMCQLTGDAARADDLTQEAVIAAFRKLGQFRSESSFRTWLSRIAINLFRMERRKAPRHESLTLETIWLPGDDDHPERRIIKSELQWCIRHSLRHHLPRKYRIVLILRDLQNLSYREIADILGCSLGRVKTDLHRGRKLFRDQFVKEKCRAFADDYLCICEGIVDL
jgi:RNA polymerase sigma-70 factor (ECF subfamily)